jgi:two-component system sensor histidine kinase BaeS
LTLARQLSLLIAGSVVLAVIVVGGLSVFNLRNGFRDYLQARDDERLARLVAIIERRSVDDPGLNWMREDPAPMRTLMDEFSGRAPVQRQPPREDFRREPPPRREPPLPREGPAPDERTRPPRPPDSRADPPPERPPRGAAGVGTLGERLLIRDAEGRRLAGRLQPPGARHTTLAIKVDGQEVGFADLMAEPEPEGIDAHFLQRQTRLLLWAALGTITVALLGAVALARRWSKPLRALQKATREIARGQRSIGLQPTGALEIAQLMEDVNTMGHELARLEQARRTWIAQISHELRTPLSVLRGEMEALEDGARQPTPQVLAGLRDEVMQLTRLVDDLHTLSVADMGGMRCSWSDGDAHAWLWRVTQRHSAAAQRLGITLTLPVVRAPAIGVRWDFGRIEQLLSNLLSNSLRYTDAPGTIAVSWTHGGRWLTLTVDDSAPGVSAADMPELFEPLFRADRARQRLDANGHAQGSGLGLSIVRAIVLAHHGTVEAGASTMGGLQVRVRLPLLADRSAA